MINISNYTSKDKSPPWRHGGWERSRARAGTGSGRLVPRAGQRGPAGLFRRGGVALAAGVVLDWLAYLLRRWTDRRFATCDTEAYWWGWQISKARGGLGRRYRDIRFDTLAACALCAGAGVRADAPCGLPCGTCQGTGRANLGEVD